MTTLRTSSRGCGADWVEGLLGAWAAAVSAALREAEEGVGVMAVRGLGLRWLWRPGGAGVR